MFILRRGLFVLTMFQASIVQYPSVQLLLLASINYMAIVYQGLARPQIGSLDNKIELFNQTMVAFVTFHMFYFTDFLPTPEM